MSINKITEGLRRIECLPCPCHLEQSLLPFERKIWYEYEVINNDTCSVEESRFVYLYSMLIVVS
jgi:hypothetical protein